MKEFSPEDLLEYQYNEMTPEQRKALEDQLKSNWSLRQKMEVIREAANRLNKSIEKPRLEVINAIVAYAARHEKVSI
ncbi:MAG: hypothetical protein V4717_02620 [Bacteroidota bacterium]